jgi:hypothetical protein
MHITWYVIVVSGEHSQTVKLTLPLSEQNDWSCAVRCCQGKYRVNWAICRSLVSGWLLVMTRNHLQIISRFSSSFSLEYLDAANCDFSGTIPDPIFSIASLSKSLILRKIYTCLFGPLLPSTFPYFIVSLNLASNRITGSIPSGVSMLTNLGMIICELFLFHLRLPDH